MGVEETGERTAVKRCPACAEDVRQEALVCRFCGYDFRAGTIPAGGPSGTSGLAIASLVVAVLWLGGLGSIVALVFGYMARREIERSGGALAGTGLATAGIVIGWIGLLLPLLFVLLPAVVFIS